MLKILVIFVLTAFTLGWPSMSHEQQAPPDHKNQKTQSPADPIPPTHVVIEPSAAINQLKPVSNPSQTQPPEEPLPRFIRPEWVIVYITAMYAVIAGLTLRAIKRQANTMEAQARDTRESSANASQVAQETLEALTKQATVMEFQAQQMVNQTFSIQSSSTAAQRSAEVALQQIQMMKDKERARIQVTPRDFDTVQIGENDNNHMVIEFLNLGPTNAFNVRAEGDGRFTVKDFDSQELEMTDLVLPPVLRPGIPETSWVPLWFDGKAGDEVRYMQAKTTIEMKGVIEYDDVFGEGHKSSFHFQMFVYGWERSKAQPNTAKMKRMGGWRKIGPPEDNHAS